MSGPTLLTEAEATPVTPGAGGGLSIRLHPRRRGQPRFDFHHEVIVAADPAAPAPSTDGPIERRIVALSRKLDALSARWAATQSKIPDWARRALDWLQSHRPVDEELLRALCSAERVEVIHPAEWRPRKARHRWRRLLHQGRDRHLLRMILWGALIPPTLILTVIPGPNVFGFYASYRAVCHALAWQGSRRALKGSLPVELRPTSGET